MMTDTSPCHLVINGHDNSPPSSDANSENVDIDEGHKGARRAILMATGSDPFKLTASCIKLAKEFLSYELKMQQPFSAPRADILEERVGASSSSNPIEPLAKAESNLRVKRGPGPSFVDYFGWCSWDSFYTDLSAPRVVSGLESFKVTGVIPRFLILDDGWQGTDVSDRLNGKQWGGRLTSFHANFKFHPDYHGPDHNLPNDISQDDVHQIPGASGRNIHSRHSLASLIDTVKSNHNIKHLLVWHTLSGYWAGVKPTVESVESVETECNDSNNEQCPQTTLDEMSEYQSSLTFPSIPHFTNRMSLANALESEPFTVDGIGLVHPDKVKKYYFIIYRSILYHILYNNCSIIFNYIMYTI